MPREDLSYKKSGKKDSLDTTAHLRKIKVNATALIRGRQGASIKRDAGRPPQLGQVELNQKGEEERVTQTGGVKGEREDSDCLS